MPTVCLPCRDDVCLAWRACAFLVVLVVRALFYGVGEPTKIASHWHFAEIESGSRLGPAPDVSICYFSTMVRSFRKVSSVIDFWESERAGLSSSRSHRSMELTRRLRCFKVF